MGHKTLFITTIVQMGRQALPDVIGSLVFLLKRAMDISFSLAGEREKEKKQAVSPVTTSMQSQPDKHRAFMILL